jgi:hypothetical protein
MHMRKIFVSAATRDLRQLPPRRAGRQGRRRRVTGSSRRLVASPVPGPISNIRTPSRKPQLALRATGKFLADTNVKTNEYLDRPILAVRTRYPHALQALWKAGSGGRSDSELRSLL